MKSSAIVPLEQTLINNENNFITMKTISRKPRTKDPRKMLLKVFLETPTQEMYESQAKRKAGVSTGAANKYLKELARDKTLLLRKAGKMNFYRLNRESSLVKRMKIEHSLSLPLAGRLKEIGRKLGIEMYIYGSVSRGEDTEDSDWDVLVLGAVKSHLIEREMAPIRKKTKRKIKLSIFTKNEWIGMSRKDTAFYERVEKDKVKLE